MPTRSAEEIYTSLKKERGETLEHLEATHRKFSNARIILSIGVLVFAIGALESTGVWSFIGWGGAFLAAAGFVVLVVLHERNVQARKNLHRRIAYFERALRRVNDTWQNDGVRDRSFAPQAHPYAEDLDLFGPMSLFQKICEARTRAGRERLATWFCEPAEVNVARTRQRAIKELCENVELRENLAVLGNEVKEQVDIAAMVAWGQSPSPELLRQPWLKFAAWLLPASVIAGGVAWMMALVEFWWLLPILVLEWLTMRSVQPLFDRVLREIDSRAHDIGVLGHMMMCVEEKKFKESSLVAIVDKIKVEGRKPSIELIRLKRRVECLEAYTSGWFALIAFPLLWPVHGLFALEAWRSAVGPRLAYWVDAMAELEALTSISAYAFENPEDPFAEFVDAGPRYEAEEIGHPLLPKSQCVRNSIVLDSKQQALLISGSNMSGKSTFLRSVGINAVLAQAGAPVRAKRMCLSTLYVGATVRIEDSLQAGRSRFYAEIVRLKAIVDLADQARSDRPRHLLFLLDEVFHGTNSRDRRISAEALLRLLIEKQALGLVSTHDLELTKVAEELHPRIRNVHFCDELRGDQLHFDYRMQPGVVQRSNAQALMQAVGLSLPIVDPPEKLDRNRTSGNASMSEL